jgi:DHA3 family macrolide efflux protein-like MFS transporter
VLTLLRTNRSFSIFLVTQATSNLGDATRNVIVPLLVLQLTHSPALVAAILLLQTATGLALRLPFGALLDRWDRRRTMLFADIGRGVITLLIPLTAALHGPVLVALFAATIPLSVLSTLFTAGFGAITPSLVDKDHVAEAYGLVEGGESLAWVVGPLVAGLLFVAVDAANALIVDGVSFLVSAAGLVVICVPVTKPSGERKSLWRDILNGLRFLVGNPRLRRAVMSWMLYGAIGYGAVNGLVYVGSHGGRTGPAVASLAVAAYAGGSVLGTLGAGWRKPPSPWLTISCCLLVIAVGAALVAVGIAPTIIVGALLFGLGEGFFLVVYLALQADTTPDELMGRITSATSLLSSLAVAVGIGWMGLALQLLNGSAAFAIVAALALVLGAGLAMTRPRAQPDPAVA